MSGRYLLPTILQRTSYGEHAVDPYALLLRNRIVFLGTVLDDTAANDLMAQLLYLDHDQPGREISLYINSPGGSVTAMTAVYDTIRYLSSEVRTVCLGQAGSVAALLLAAGAPGRRMMLPHARVVIREPALDGSRGPASDLAIHAAELLRMRAAMEVILAEHTGRDVARVRADISRDTILSGPDALAYGIVDELLPVRVRHRGDHAA